MHLNVSRVCGICNHPGFFKGKFVSCACISIGFLTEKTAINTNNIILAFIPCMVILWFYGFSIRLMLHYCIAKEHALSSSQICCRFRPSLCVPMTNVACGQSTAQLISQFTIHIVCLVKLNMLDCMVHIAVCFQTFIYKDYGVQSAEQNWMLFLSGNNRNSYHDIYKGLGNIKKTGLTKKWWGTVDYPE